MSLSSLHNLRIYNWLLTELDKKDRIAFGWTDQKDSSSGVWRYIYVPEVESLGAIRDANWKPMYFNEARKLISGYLHPVGSKLHFEWWKHENEDDLKLGIMRVAETSQSNFDDYARWYYRSIIMKR